MCLLVDWFTLSHYIKYHNTPPGGIPVIPELSDPNYQGRHTDDKGYVRTYPGYDIHLPKPIILNKLLTYKLL